MNWIQPVSCLKYYETKLVNITSISTYQRKGHILSKANAKKTKIVDYLYNWKPSYI